MARFFDQDAAIQNFIDNLSDVECKNAMMKGMKVLVMKVSLLSIMFFSIFCPKKAILSHFFQYFSSFSARYLLLKVYFYFYTDHNRHTKLSQVFA